MSLASWCRTLQDSQAGTAFRESLWLFPIVETTHVVGLAFSVGLVVLLDLRLIGFHLGGLPPAQIIGQLKRWYLAGFAVMFLTGLALFSAAAFDLYESPTFRWKLFFLGVAGVNAAVFEYVVEPQVQETAGDQPLPRSARLVGWCSIASWIAVIALGRLTAYNL